VQSAQAVSARLLLSIRRPEITVLQPAGAIELIIEGFPCSAFIEPSQSAILSSEPGWIGCQGESMLAMVANSVAIWQAQNAHAMKGRARA